MGGAAVAGESAVNRAQMATAATQVEDAVGQIRGLQMQMNGYHADTMAGWQGQAASAFTAAFESFSADFAKVLQALDGMHEKLIGTRTNYQTTEDTNTSAVNKINGLLNR
jgi:WXG100 family type VII secretion target